MKIRVAAPMTKKIVGQAVPALGTVGMMDGAGETELPGLGDVFGQLQSRSVGH